MYSDFSEIRDLVLKFEGNKKEEKESFNNLITLLNKNEKEIKSLKEEKIEKDKEMEKLKRELKLLKEEQNDILKKFKNFTPSEKIKELIEDKTKNIIKDIEKNKSEINACKRNFKELNNKYEEHERNINKQLDDLNEKIDIVDEKLKINKSTEIFKVSKPSNKEDDLNIFKCQNDIEVLQKKVKNIVEINDIKELIKKEIGKNDILNGNKWEEIDKNIRIMLDFKKKGTNDFSTMNDRINKQDSRLDKIDIKLSDGLINNNDKEYINNTVNKMKKNVIEEYEKINLVSINNFEENLTKKIEEIKKTKEDYVEKRIKGITEGWNKIVDRIKNCENSIKDINDFNENIKEKNNNINTSKKEENNNNNKEINNKNLKKQENKKELNVIVENKIKDNKLKICAKCLGYNHTIENCMFKNSKPCTKCKFFHIGCRCFRDRKGLIIYYTFKKKYTKVAEVIKKRNYNDIFIKNYKIIKPIRKAIWRKRNIFRNKEEDNRNNEKEKFEDEKDF